MSDEIAVKVHGLSKSFKLPHEKHSSLKSLFLNIFRSKRSFEKQEVLKNVSFEIKKGEFFGVVGRNGSGKSTLLKLIAGIYSPDKGYIQVNGRLTPFIELGVGFSPELTGRENVFLNGALLGFSRNEMNLMYDEIVKFAELEKFMDQKLKNYSSGMQVRLAFSIAIQAKGDILVLDEVLAVGDAAFQQKCVNYFEELKQNNRTVILVTHDMNSVKRFCSKALILESGKIEANSTPSDIANLYTLENLNTQSKPLNAKKNENLAENVKLLEVQPVSSLTPDAEGDLEFEISYELNKDVEIDLGISIVYQGQSIVEQNTKGINLGHKKGKIYKLRYSFPCRQFVSKPMSVDVAIFERKRFKLIGYHLSCFTFEVNSRSETAGGILNTRGKWEEVK